MSVIALHNGVGKGVEQGGAFGEGIDVLRCFKGGGIGEGLLYQTIEEGAVNEFAVIGGAVGLAFWDEGSQGVGGEVGLLFE